MKKKILVSFLLVMIIMANFNIVFAAKKFDLSWAQSNTDSDTMTYEQLKTDKNGNYTDERVGETHNLEGDGDDDIGIQSARKGDIFWYHCFYEKNNLDVTGGCGTDENEYNTDDEEQVKIYTETTKGGAKGQFYFLRYDTEGDNGIEFMIKATPTELGNSTIKVYIVDDGDECEFEFFINFYNTTKSDEELEVDKIKEAWKDDSLLDTTGKDANKIAEDIELYISSDCYQNDGKKLKSWTREQIVDKINKLKADTDKDYSKMINNLENIVTVMDAKKSMSDEEFESQMQKIINGIATDTAKEIQSLLSVVTMGDDGDRPGVTFIDVLTDIDKYVPDESSDGVSDFAKKGSVILTIITNIGSVIAVLMCAIIGIKYMLGSVEEKAEYKKDLIPYLIGAALLFGICTFVTILQEFGKGINAI